MRNPLRNVRRDHVAAAIIFAVLCWLVFAVPIFLLGIGMFGATISDGIQSALNSAASGEAFSIIVIGLTLSLIGLPWALLVVGRDR